MLTGPANDEQAGDEGVETLLRSSSQQRLVFMGTACMGVEAAKGLTMVARQANSTHGLSSHDVSKRLDGSQRSVPKLKTALRPIAKGWPELSGAVMEVKRLGMK